MEFFRAAQIETLFANHKTALMLSQRFEKDMVEISGDGYLMLCQGRGRVFLKGTPADPIDLTAVSSFSSTDGLILVQGTAGEIAQCPFPATSNPELEQLVLKLNQVLAGWGAGE